MSDTVTVTYKAQKGTHIVRAATAREAVQQFLAQYKNREFSVSEYRNGAFIAQLYVRPGEKKDSCFYRKFASRDEARAFCAETEAMA